MVAGNPYRMSPEQVQRQVELRALQMTESNLSNCIFSARGSVKYLAGVIRSMTSELEVQSRADALKALREHRFDSYVYVAGRRVRRELTEKVARVIDSQSGCGHEVALAEARRVLDPNAPFAFSSWRHGGWYVHGVRYPSGACGCVSKNYPDGKWRIACDSRRTQLGAEGDFTFESRELAARAEQLLAIDEWCSYSEPVDIEQIQQVEAPRA